MALILLGLVTAITVNLYPWTIGLTVISIAMVYISLRNSLRMSQLTREAVESLADVIDRRDPYTFGHSQRVAEITQQLASTMGLSWEQVLQISAAARVHDLGKIEIDASILRKPGKLNGEEWELMRRHPIAGSEIASKFPDFSVGTSFIRHHHERWDGHGYPDGLQGTSIPLGARIIAVADAYDAMASDRPYRRALTQDVIERELERGAGRQWDPDVVDAMLRLLRHGGEKRFLPTPSLTPEHATVSATTS
ncbi:MAG TPA: HD-GYP domain-containing protein [Anaerolineae bacterium]|nr:HD-GYP domain-containing protein [Anaerolineae bacterium]